MNYFYYCLRLLSGLLLLRVMLALALMLGISQSSAQQQDSIEQHHRSIVFFYSNQPPFEYLDKTGKPSGIAIEKVKALFNKLDMPITFVFDSVNRGVLNLHAGKYDVSTAVSPTKELEKSFLVSQQPLYRIELSAIRKALTPAISEIEQISTLPYAAISENTFAFIEQYLQAQHPLSQRYDVKDFRQGVNLVENGRLPYFLTYVSATDFTQQNDLVADAVLSAPVYLVVSRQHRAAEYLINQFNSVMSR